MNRPGFGGPSSVSFSTRVTENGCSPSELRDEDLDYLRIELSKMEEEIQTLRQVLLVKEKYAADIRRQLGMSPLSNIKQNLSKGWHDIQTSSPYLSASATLEDISHSSIYVRTRDGLSQAGQATSSALSGVGVAVTRRLADMRALPLPSPPRHTISVPSMRHSSTFKSFEDMVGNVKKAKINLVNLVSCIPSVQQVKRSLSTVTDVTEFWSQPKGNNSTFSVLELPQAPPRVTAARAKDRPYKTQSKPEHSQRQQQRVDQEGQVRQSIYKWAIVTSSSSSTSSHPHLSTAPGDSNIVRNFKVIIFHRAVFHLRSEKMAAIPSSGSLIATHDYYRRRLGSASSSSSCGSAEYTGEVIPHHPGLPRQDSGHWWTSFFFAKPTMNGPENLKNGTYTVANGQVTCIAREMVLNRQLSESSESGKSEPSTAPASS
ncbi:uncharacterized protein V6R79_011407 [Siganus canaliculatus]